MFLQLPVHTVSETRRPQQECPPQCHACFGKYLTQEIRFIISFREHKIHFLGSEVFTAVIMDSTVFQV
jgi:hypothetical protein